jgi:CO/xanthine dehydrogenase FAD-binding subunit
VRALEAEKVFQSKESAHRLVEEAMPIIMKAVSPISDVRSGKEYRANLVKILTHRLVNKLWEAS